MRVRTDDEVYRVDAVWLGPPKATFPWRARYVAYGVGIATFFVVLGIERQLGFGFSFFTTAYGIVITVALTRLFTTKITHERPLGAVFTMFMHELGTPRETNSTSGGAASATRIKVRNERPRPQRKRTRHERKSDQPRRVSSTTRRTARTAVAAAQHSHHPQPPLPTGPRRYAPQPQRPQVYTPDTINFQPSTHQQEAYGVRPPTQS